MHEKWNVTLFFNLHDNHDGRRSHDHSHRRKRLIHVTNDQCVHNCLNGHIQPIHHMPLQSNTMRSNNPITREREKRKFVLNEKKQNHYFVTFSQNFLCSFAFFVHKINILCFWAFNSSSIYCSKYSILYEWHNHFNHGKSHKKWHFFVLEMTLFSILSSNLI